MPWSYRVHRGLRLLLRRCASSVALLVLLAAAAVTAPVKALDVFTLKRTEAGYPLGTYLGVLEDPTGKLTIEEVTKREESAFVESEARAPGFGFSNSAFWLRFTIRNVDEVPRPWLLELSYPHLDWVELYIPRDDGSFEVRRTGDHRPFAERDLEHRNFVFRLTEPPAESERTYYMRVQTAGSVNLPVSVWTPEEFHVAQNHEQPVLWMFYGLILVMALYNAFIFLSVREPDYLYYVLYILSYALFQFTLNGYTFQFLLPNQNWLANQILPCMMGSAWLWSVHFQRHYLRMRETMPRMDVAMNLAAWATAAVSLYGLFGPYKWSVRFLVWNGLLLTMWLLGNAIYLSAKGMKAARYYLLGWGMFRIGIFLYAMKTAGALPNNFLTNWSIQIGSAIEVVFFSLALADRINTMRGNLAQLNAQLTQNVQDLREALTKAEAATVAKSNFLATVSHELRTPLNSIINIPGGLLQDLPVVEVAICSSCHSIFEMDAGETISLGTACPECSTLGSLALARRRELRGSPDEFAVNLGQIERAGKHLLQVVDGVLDFSRLEAQRLKLNLEDVQVAELLHESLDPLLSVAASKGVKLELQPLAAGLRLRCDALRVRQILLNLVNNAIKFADGRGTVTVGVREEEKALLFFVRDQGIGIAAEDVPRLFRSFEQVHQGNTRRFGGTGLGLSICRSLVEMHHGEIWVESELGKGSTFSFRIPKSTAPEAAAPVPLLGQPRTPAPSTAFEVANDARPPAPAYDIKELARDAKGSTIMRKVGSDTGTAKKEARRERLLYVEDDDDNFQVAEMRLRDCYELVRAADAEQACARLREPGGWSAILMDIELRGSELDGVELTKLFRGRLRRDSLPTYAKDFPPVDVPILFVTAHGAKYSDAALLLSGAEKVIPKPVDFGALNLALTELHLSRARKKSRAGT